MADREKEYVSLGVEAMPSGLAEFYRDGQWTNHSTPRYEQPPNKLRVQGLVEIAIRYMKGPPRSR